MNGTQGAPWGGKNGKRAMQRASKVVEWITMTARKSWTAQLQDLLDVGRRHTACQQRASDPQVHDAPVRLQESLGNVPAAHPALVDRGRLRAGQARGTHRLPCHRRDGLDIDIRCGVVPDGWPGRGLQEAFGPARKTGCSVQDLHPRRAVAAAAVRLLISEAGESAQMAPVGAGAVTAIQVRQVSAYGGSEGRLQGSGTDVHPRLPMAGTTLEHDARFMPVGPHHRQRGGIGIIQVDQDIAGIPVLRVGVDVDVASFPVTRPQKADGGEVRQLSGSPQPFPRKWTFARIVDQPNEIKFAGHSRQLAADRLRSKSESEVKHAPNSGIELGCRTMNWQRMVNSVLTRCLSQGAHFKPRSCCPTERRPE